MNPQEWEGTCVVSRSRWRGRCTDFRMRQLGTELDLVYCHPTCLGVKIPLRLSFLICHMMQWIRDRQSLKTDTLRLRSQGCHVFTWVLRQVTTSSLYLGVSFWKIKVVTVISTPTFMIRIRLLNHFKVP